MTKQSTCSVCSNIFLSIDKKGVCLLRSYKAVSLIFVMSLGSRYDFVEVPTR